MLHFWHVLYGSAILSPPESELLLVQALSTNAMRKTRLQLAEEAIHTANSNFFSTKRKKDIWGRFGKVGCGISRNIGCKVSGLIRSEL